MNRTPLGGWFSGRASGGNTFRDLRGKSGLGPKMAEVQGKIIIKGPLGCGLGEGDVEEAVALLVAIDIGPTQRFLSIHVLGVF